MAEDMAKGPLDSKKKIEAWFAKEGVAAVGAIKSDLTKLVSDAGAISSIPAVRIADAYVTNTGRMPLDLLEAADEVCKAKLTEPLEDVEDALRKLELLNSTDLPRCLGVAAAYLELLELSKKSKEGN